MVNSKENIIKIINGLNIPKQIKNDLLNNLDNIKQEQLFEIFSKYSQKLELSSNNIKRAKLDYKKSLNRFEELSQRDSLKDIEYILNQ